MYRVRGHIPGGASAHPYSNIVRSFPEIALNAYAERWVRSVKEECLSRLILLGEDSLRHVLNEYVDHYHQERNHQGKGNVLLFPRSRPAGENEGTIQCRERLGGLLKYYEREAA